MRESYFLKKSSGVDLHVGQVTRDTHVCNCYYE